MSESSSDTPDCEGCHQRDREIEQLEETIARLEGKVEKLEARLGKNSTNSSKPPSSDGPGDRGDRDGSDESDRSQGAQPGHDGHWREDVEAPDEEIDIKPDACDTCGESLEGHDADPSTHQVTDVEIRHIVRAYHLHTLECTSCGGWTHADLPDEVPSRQFGPTISAVVTFLTGVAHLSKRNTQRTLDEVFGVEMSLGSVSNTEATVTEALSGPYERVRGWVSESPRVHLDETRWSEGRDDGWMWTISDGEVVAYRIAPSRGSDVARQLLEGEPAGEVVTDRHGAYNWIDTDKRHLCWPHLYRNFKGWGLEPGIVGSIGRLLTSYTWELFEWLERIRDGPADTMPSRQKIEELRETFSFYLELGAKVVKDDRNRFAQLLDVEEAMWSFLDADGWPTNNNEAERSLRPVVIWRTLSFGTESDRGSRFVERILTAAETLKRQGRSAMNYIEGVWEHIAYREPMPALLPN